MEKQILSFTEKADIYNAARIKSLHRELVDQAGAARRIFALARYLENSLPAKIQRRCEISFSGYSNYIYASIKPKFTDFTEHDTILITNWCAEHDKWKFEKKLNESTGRWYHSLARYVCKWNAHYEIEFSTITNIDGCEMEEVEETRKIKVFKKKC